MIKYVKKGRITTSKRGASTLLDITTHLILIKNKDKTDQIETCVCKAGKWLIKYQNTPKLYTYNETNVSCYQNPLDIDTATNIVYENDQPISGVIRILDFREHVRIIFKSGFHRIYPRSVITIEENGLKTTKQVAALDI